MCPSSAGRLICHPGQRASDVSYGLCFRDGMLRRSYGHAWRPYQCRHGDFTYLPDGTVRLDLSAGSSILTSGTGDDAIVLSQRTAEARVCQGMSYALCQSRSVQGSHSGV